MINSESNQQPPPPVKDIHQTVWHVPSSISYHCRPLVSQNSQSVSGSYPRIWSTSVVAFDNFIELHIWYEREDVDDIVESIQELIKWSKQTNIEHTSSNYLFVIVQILHPWIHYVNVKIMLLRLNRQDNYSKRNDECVNWTYHMASSY